MSSPTAIARHVVVHGKVQGVSFRMLCAEQARGAGVTGWVQNQSDGTVEAWFEGELDDVDQVLAWCHQGPPGARVQQVVVVEDVPRGDTEFEVR